VYSDSYIATKEKEEKKEGNHIYVLLLNENFLQFKTNTIWFKKKCIHCTEEQGRKGYITAAIVIP